MAKRSNKMKGFVLIAGAVATGVLAVRAFASVRNQAIASDAGATSGIKFEPAPVVEPAVYRRIEPYTLPTTDTNQGVWV